MDSDSYPRLTIVAGCNGAGKSSFSNAISPGSTSVFDYDKVYLNIYQSLLDSELRETISHNKARAVLESSISKAIDRKEDFTYETNFNSSPLHWPRIFKNAGYKLSVIFFCLDSLQEAKRRVQIRVENGGHFVPEWEIKKRYYQGFENLNSHWQFFDEVHLFDTSRYLQKPEYLLSIIDQRMSNFKRLPSYLSLLLPDLTHKNKIN